MNEFVRQTKNKLTLKEFEVLNTSNLDYVGNYMGFNIQNEEKKLSIKIVFIEVCTFPRCVADPLFLGSI
jgi:hypothetical protein